MDARKLQLYLMNVEGTNRFKIGISVNPEQRRETVQMVTEGNVLLVKSWQVEYPEVVELELHRKFEGKNLNFNGFVVKGAREWFLLNDTDLQELEALVQSEIDNPTLKRIAHVKKVTVYLTDKTREELKQLAEEEGVKQHELLKEAIYLLFKSRGLRD